MSQSIVTKKNESINLLILMGQKIYLIIYVYWRDEEKNIWFQFSNDDEFDHLFLFLNMQILLM